MWSKKIVLGSALAIAAISFSFKGDEDALSKKKYVVQVSEMKDGKPKSAKTVEDEIEFKGGKVFSNVVYEKHEFKWLKYTITKDSTYEDEGEQKHYIEASASSENDNKELMTMTFRIDNYDISGSYKLTKKDVVKKLYEFTGKEKEGKKKKEKAE